MTHINCLFTNNHAVSTGGVIHAQHYCALIMKYCDVNHNTARYGGAINVESCTLHIENNRFYNHAATLESVLLARTSNIVTLSNRIISSNNSTRDTGTLYLASCNISFMSIAIINNNAHRHEGITKGIIYATNSYINTSQCLLISGNILGVDANIIYIEKCTCEVNERFTFLNNSGSFMANNSWIAFHGYTRFQDCSYSYDYSTVENGGAITTIMR